MNVLLTKEFDSDEEDDEYIPNKKELEEDIPKEEIKKEVNKTKIDDIWAKLKNKNKNNENASANIIAKEQSQNIKEDNNKFSDNKESLQGINKNPSDDLSSNLKQDNKLSSLDEEIQKAIQKSKDTKNKLATETVLFAGQKFEYRKVLTEEDLKKQRDKEKKKTHSGLDNLVDQLEKKSNINTYSKTKKDWNNYVEEKKIEKELDYNRKDGFLTKKHFIDETNMKLIENKKNTKRQKKE
jgi:hypothetical protein